MSSGKPYRETIGDIVFLNPKWKRKPQWSDAARKAQSERAKKALRGSDDYGENADRRIIEGFLPIRSRFPGWKIVEHDDDVTVVECLIYNPESGSDGSYAVVQYNGNGDICAWIEAGSFYFDRDGYKTIASAIYYLEYLMAENGLK